MDLLARLAPCGLLSLAPDGTVDEANDTFLRWVGLGIDEVRGRPFPAFLEQGSVLYYETRHAPITTLGADAPPSSMTLQAAGGRRLPVLLDSTTIEEGDVRRTLLALFDATERVGYEQTGVETRRLAEQLSREARVLSGAANAFAIGSTEAEIAGALAELAMDAFHAPAAGVFLIDPDGGYQLIGGTSPLEPHLRSTPRIGRRAIDEDRIIVVSDAQQAGAISPALAAAFRAARVEAMTVTPVVASTTAQPAVLATYFGRAREFDEKSLDLHRELARQASLAFERARRQFNERIEAMHDPLTGLPNRQLFEEQLHDLMVAAAGGGQLVGLLFLDLDGFKAVNDALGHPVGDILLAQVGTRMRLALRDDDPIGRYGGDEFVAAWRLDHELSAAVVGERIRTEVGRRFRGIPRRYPVSASVGVVVADPTRSADISTAMLLQVADGAMYESKSAGRDRVTVVKL